MAQFALIAGAGIVLNNNQKGTQGGILSSGNLQGFLQNKGDLEKEIIRKGMSKAEAAKLAE